MINLIDNTLYSIYFAADAHYSTYEQKHAQLDAYHSIEWYVNTSRASVAWIKSLAKANLAKLIAYILRQDDQSVSGQIASTTKYLKRYCGLATC